ncbi:GNAT family N-acetyltransferase [Fictibacillus iocasae]|uniref:GNAT family N-acetyltransferase n=1 Tax=Fictibacillus iocasae TaxID=2715437 RepID=A0ABW2NMK9_9BACL
MELRVYDSIPEFYGDNEAFLMEHEDRACIVLGNCLRFAAAEWGEEKPFLAAVKEDKDTLLLAMMIPPYSMLLLEKDSAQASAAVELLASYLKGLGYGVPKIMASKAAGMAFANQWSHINKSRKRVTMDLRLYTLKQVAHPEGKTGAMRKAADQDMSYLPDWILGMTGETNQLISRKEAKNYAEERIKSGSLYIWENGGVPVAMAAKTRPNMKGASVNLVYTPKEHRGKGYASALVAALSQHLLDSGFEFCTLFTDLANPTSNKIYQKIGYMPVCDYIEYKFG